jgi:hypothetical protein
MSETPTIHFKFDGDRYLDNVTWDLMIAMESGMNYAQSKQLCAVFLVNGQDEYYPLDEAMAVLGALKLRQVTDAANQLQVFVNELGKAPLPLASNKP